MYVKLLVRMKLENVFGSTYLEQILGRGVRWALSKSQMSFKGGEEAWSSSDFGKII